VLAMGETVRTATTVLSSATVRTAGVAELAAAETVLAGDRPWGRIRLWRSRGPMLAERKSFLRAET